MLPMPFPWYLLPQLEFARFKAIDFFPPKPARIEVLRSICIGSKSRSIGDALMLSSLPRRLKQRYPKLRILTYPRGFNPVVFWNNPHVDGMSFLPDALYGDDSNEGSGHLIQMKERFFGVESSESPRPELYLTDSEIRWARDFVIARSADGRLNLPLLVIHPFGSTLGAVLEPQVWARFVGEQSERFRIAQVGVDGQTAIPGCDFHFLAPKKRAAGRRLFALLKAADRFIGIDSGPMHVARAFGIPSLIVTERAPLHAGWRSAFLYEDVEYLHVSSLDATGVVRGMSEFATRFG